MPRPIRVTVGPQQFIKKGTTRFDWHDPYYFAVSLSWPRFFLLFVAAEVVINTIFATLYLLQPGAVANQPGWPFLSAFFFSLETLATVGYGEMYPATLYGHVVSAVEILTGVIFMAIITGLMFVRFSKPKAKVIYADNAVVTRHNGKTTLMLRMGNARHSTLLDVHARLYVLVRTVSDEGHRAANIVELPLIRDRFPVFAILWTVMHVIDETSALAEFPEDYADLRQVRLFLTISAYDPAIGQAISDFHQFSGADFRFGSRYVDAIEVDDDNKVNVDYTLLSATEPDGLAP